MNYFREEPGEFQKKESTFEYDNQNKQITQQAHEQNDYSLNPDDDSSLKSQDNSMERQKSK